MFSIARELELKKLLMFCGLDEEILLPYPPFSVLLDGKIRRYLASYTNNYRAAIKKKNDHKEQLENTAHPLGGEDKEYVYLGSTSIVKL